ncbi:MAG: RIP metalloprotease RseP [Hydrogenovibrio sp.]
MTILWSVLGFIVAMGILVTIHEWGHYIVARAFNIKVTHFSLGFGKVFYRRQWGETQFQLSVVPLGGYVRFVDEREGPVAPEDRARAFNRQSVYRRFAVVAAGPVVNLVFAWLAFSLIYFSGVSGLKPVFQSIPPKTPLAEAMPNNDQAWQVLSVNEQSVLDWRAVYQQVLQALAGKQSYLDVQVQPLNGGQDQNLILPLKGLDINQPEQDWLSSLGFRPEYPPFQPVINQVVAGSPAENMGLETGDRVVKIDGYAVDDWSQLVEYVRSHPSKPVELQVDRNGRSVTLAGVLGEVSSGQTPVGRLGASVQLDEAALAPYRITQSFGLLASLEKGWQHTVGFVDMTLNMIRGMLFGDVSLQNLSGPVSIAEFSGKAMQSGWVSFLTLLGLLSLSLGILNLLPIPVLDGGHLMFYLVEMLKGSPVSEAVEVAAQKVGLALILTLTFFALFNDVVRISNG